MERLGNRAQPDIRNAVNGLMDAQGLPVVKGKTFYVDPDNGSNAASGLTLRKAVADLQTAYGLCVTGRGDCIVLLSGGTASGDTTSYLSQTLLWTKHGITVVGVAAPTRMYGRARIANVERTTGALTDLSFANDGTADKINRAAGSFITDGFEAGQTINVDSTSNTNDGNFTIASVTALQIVLSASDALTTEDAATAGATTIKTYNAAMIIVSGDNNAFHNVHIGNFGSLVTAVGCVKVTGNRNYFGKCHFIGAGHATPGAATGAYDLELAGAQETTFESCTFGTDTIIKAATNASIRFSAVAASPVWRTRFHDCMVYSYSDTSTHGAILSAGADSISGIQLFTSCQILNWNDNGIGLLASVFIGTKPTSGALVFDNNSFEVGYTAWDSVGGDDMVYVAAAAAGASGAGGIGITV